MYCRRKDLAGILQLWSNFFNRYDAISRPGIVVNGKMDFSTGMEPTCIPMEKSTKEVGRRESR